MICPGQLLRYDVGVGCRRQACQVVDVVNDFRFLHNGFRLARCSTKAAPSRLPFDICQSSNIPEKVLQPRTVRSWRIVKNFSEISMIFDKIKFVRHFVRNRVSEFDTNAVSSEVLLYRNNDWTLDRFVILIHNSTDRKSVV